MPGLITPASLQGGLMASSVDISNLALTILGADRITALSDSSENARRLTAIYDMCLEDVLRAHPWNFAIVRVGLSLLVSTPVFGYSYEFQLPSDCLRVIEVNDGSNVVSGSLYKIEGRKLLSDYDDVNIKYISNITDPNQYTSQFIMVLASRLAMELAYAITNNKSTAELIVSLYASRLQTAKETDAQESSSVNTEDQDYWTISQRV
jgi:hypothetical protein